MQKQPTIIISSIKDSPHLLAQVARNTDANIRIAQIHTDLFAMLSISPSMPLKIPSAFIRILIFLASFSSCFNFKQRSSASCASLCCASR